MTLHAIQTALLDVERQRAAAAQTPALRQAVVHIKALQARRFAHTYADVLAGDAGAASADAADFFLTHLYGPGDFSARDQQFGRIAPHIERRFPQRVAATAAALARLHALSETLDLAMGAAWLAGFPNHTPAPLSALASIANPQACLAWAPQAGDGDRYAACWRQVGQPEQRQSQLAMVNRLGQELRGLTTLPGLRMLLTLMRQPARAAGLSELQQFLESGFDRFNALRRDKGLAAEGSDSVTRFLARIQERERALIDVLNAPSNAVAPATSWDHLLGFAR
jgi:hypothetical protein